MSVRVVMVGKLILLTELDEMQKAEGGLAHYELPALYTGSVNTVVNNTPHAIGNLSSLRGGRW
eukprot:13662-Amphidinium_carterae.1